MKGTSIRSSQKHENLNGVNYESLECESKAMENDKDRFGEKAKVR